MVEIAYFLAERGFVELDVIEGEDGNEMIVLPTEMGRSYLRCFGGKELRG
jgi:hypothetical protein